MAATEEIKPDTESKVSHNKMDGKSQADTNHAMVSAASVALAAALAEQKPTMFSRNMMKLWRIMGIGYLISTMNGFGINISTWPVLHRVLTCSTDSSLMGAINAMKPYQETFGLDGAGSTTGIVFITYNLGQIAAFPFCGLLADGLGRRWCIFIGCATVMLGTGVQAAANDLGQFIGGRFVLGFGAAVASAAAPAYIVELAHPAYRGFMAGMYNNLWCECALQL